MEYEINEIEAESSILDMPEEEENEVLIESDEEGQIENEDIENEELYEEDEENEEGNTKTENLKGKNLDVDNKRMENESVTETGEEKMGKEAKKSVTEVEENTFLETMDLVNEIEVVQQEESETEMTSQISRKPLKSEVDDFDNLLQYLTVDSEGSEDVSKDKKEEEEIENVEEKHEFDRCLYNGIYHSLRQQIEIEKYTNMYLQKKLVDYYCGKKIFHVFLLKEGVALIDAKKKYNKLLDELDEFHELTSREKTTTNSILYNLEMKCKTNDNEADALFANLLRHELESAKEIINSNTEKANAEKYIERSIKRQKIQLSNLIKMRLDYIKLKNKYTFKENALNALDNLGPGLYLVDYEQLKIDNRNYIERIEEKEIELNAVRRKCHNAAQKLAHRREKVFGLDGDIDALERQYDILCQQYNKIRKRSNQIKQQKIQYRKSIHKIKLESGLVTRPILLRDMQFSNDEIQKLTREIEMMKDACDQITKQMHILRNHLNSQRNSKTSKKESTVYESSLVRKGSSMQIIS